MRKALGLSVLALAALVSPTLSMASNITYTVNGPVGPGHATGTITTDGTFGTLTTADILTWTLALTDGSGGSFTLLGPLSGANSTDVVTGTDLTANATQLLFDFSGPAGVFLLENPVVGGNGPFLCYSSITTCSPPNVVGVSLSTQVGEGFSVAVPLSGSIQIASATPAATPEPSSLMLLGSGMLGLVGVARRKMAGIGARC